MSQYGPKSWRDCHAPKASKLTTSTTTTTDTLGHTWTCPQPSIAHRGPRDRNRTSAEQIKWGSQDEQDNYRPLKRIKLEGSNPFFARPSKPKEEIAELRKKGILGEIRKTTIRQTQTLLKPLLNPEDAKANSG